MSHESFCPFSLLSSTLRREKTTDRKTDWKEMALLLLRQNYSMLPGFIWQNLSSQLLLRWKPNSQRPPRTKVIQTPETPSGQSSQLGRCDGSEVAWITLTLHPFWLLSGHKLSDLDNLKMIFSIFTETIFFYNSMTFCRLGLQITDYFLEYLINCFIYEMSKHVKNPITISKVRP